MSFDWADYLELSIGLMDRKFDNIKDEALYRCVASRSYYSLVIMGANHCKSKNEIITYTHTDVASYFRSRPSQKEKQIASDLDKLKTSRIKADYWDALDENPIALAQNSVRMAKRSIHNLSTLS